MGLLAGTLRRVERIELVMNRWADTCMRFMPRDWVEAQGFVWADAVLAAVLLGLVTLSYVMLAHMLRSWGVGSQNSTASAPKSMRAAAPAASGSGAEAARDGGGFSSGGRDATSCAEYGPVHEEIDGMTALMRASSQGDEACAVELIQKGASVDARDSQEGFTALLMASAMGESLAAPVFLLPAASLGGARGGAFAPVHGSSPVPPPPHVSLSRPFHVRRTGGRRHISSLLSRPWGRPSLACRQRRRQRQEQRRRDGADARNVRAEGERGAQPDWKRRQAGPQRGPRLRRASRRALTRRRAEGGVPLRITVAWLAAVELLVERLGGRGRRDGRRVGAL